jgi:hypothetical protein
MLCSQSEDSVASASAAAPAYDLNFECSALCGDPVSGCT